VSCRPQAWAAGSVFLLLQQTLGLHPDLEGRRVVLRPRLAAGTRTLSLRRLAILGSQLDLDVRAEDGRANVGAQGDGRPGVLVEGDDVWGLVEGRRGSPHPRPGGARIIPPRPQSAGTEADDEVRGLAAQVATSRSRRASRSAASAGSSRRAAATSA